MLTIINLYDLAKSRYEEAKILLVQNKPDGAVYLCGYALELILKRRITLHLDWDGYPDTRTEFENYRSFKIHDLSVLLKLSGFEKKIQFDNTMYAKWQIASSWDSEIRYKQLGKVSNSEAQDIINATRDIINFILRN